MRLNASSLGPHPHNPTHSPKHTQQVKTRTLRSPHEWAGVFICWGELASWIPAEAGVRVGRVITFHTPLVSLLMGTRCPDLLERE
jgi:hypothetical protein